MSMPTAPIHMAVTSVHVEQDLQEMVPSVMVRLFLLFKHFFFFFY